MEVCNHNVVSTYEEETMALNNLIKSFGKMFSLEEIASAYCNAGRDSNYASEILSKIHETSSSSSTSDSNSEIEYVKSSDEDSLSSSSSSTSSYYSTIEDMKPRSSVFFFEKIYKTTRISCPVVRRPVVAASAVSKLLWRPVSERGLSNSTHSSVTISAVPPTLVWRPIPIRGADPSTMAKGYVKLPQPHDKEGNPYRSRDISIHKDREGLICERLGVGYKFNQPRVICRNKFRSNTAKRLLIQQPRDNEGNPYRSRDIRVHNKFYQPRVICRNKKTIDRYRNSRGYSSAIFLNKNRRVIHRQYNRNNGVYDLALNVSTSPEHKDGDKRNSFISYSHDVIEDDEYDILRRAVQDFRATTKEYYVAAVQAFIKRDQIRFNKLVKQGRFYLEKAREADEQSFHKILETGKNMETEDSIALNLHENAAEDAIHLLKYHISSLAGISSIKYLKAIIEIGGEDLSKGARRRLIIKLLKKESLEWTEENWGTISIRLDTVDPKDLIFVKRNSCQNDKEMSIL